jgi:predicted RNase H-like nuclease
MHAGYSNDMHVGVDGCSDGWFAVMFEGEEYQHAKLYEDFSVIWSEWGEDADHIIVDIPIGLREDSNEPRPCDTAARKKIGDRRSSVFPTPVRTAVQSDSYEDAKEEQEERTDGSLGTQSWSISGEIDELDQFLRVEVQSAQDVVTESHPEVCFWAMNDEVPMSYSKNRQPAAAFWERVNVLEDVYEGATSAIRDASLGLDAGVSNDDIVDAFALALTAGPLTQDLRFLPEETPRDDAGDPKGLPMEIAYAPP